LAGTKVSDAGVPELCAMSHLQQLDITATQISDTGISELEAAMGAHGGLVVYPQSKTAKSPLSLTDLIAKAQAGVTASTSEPKGESSGSR
jgi:hypothetical protein